MHSGDACADATGDCAFQEGTCETHVKIPAAGVATGGEGARCAIEAGAGAPDSGGMMTEEPTAPKAALSIMTTASVAVAFEAV